MKNHFRAHQLSIWLRLIPELHRAGMEDVIARHNLFKNHDDLDLYDGPVKPDSIQKLTYLEETLKRRGGNASDLLGKPGDILQFITETQMPRQLARMIVQSQSMPSSTSNGISSELAIELGSVRTC